MVRFPQSGEIREPRPLNPSHLRTLMQNELAGWQRHAQTPVVHFTPAEWDALCWHTKECLRLNSAHGKVPPGLRKFLLKQDQINYHLVQSVRYLLMAWEAVLNHPRIRQFATNSGQPPPIECVKQAAGRLDLAEAKQQSLSHQRQPLRVLSLRQCRCHFFLFEAAELTYPLFNFTRRLHPQGDETFADLEWHLRELGHRKVHPPRTVRERHQIPLQDWTHLLAMTCHHSTAYLQALIFPSSLSE